MMNRTGLWLLCLTLLLLTQVYGLICLPAAPCPLERKDKAEEKLPAHLYGRWLLHWDDSTYLIQLDEDGNYAAASTHDDGKTHGRWQYVGKWECRRKVVWIWEHTEYPEPYWTYTVLQLGIKDKCDPECHYKDVVTAMRRPARATD